MEVVDFDPLPSETLVKVPPVGACNPPTLALIRLRQPPVFHPGLVSAVQYEQYHPDWPLRWDFGRQLEQ